MPGPGSRLLFHSTGCKRQQHAKFRLLSSSGHQGLADPWLGLHSSVLRLLRLKSCRQGLKACMQLCMAAAKGLEPVILLSKPAQRSCAHEQGPLLSQTSLWPVCFLSGDPLGKAMLGQEASLRGYLGVDRERASSPQGHVCHARLEGALQVDSGLVQGQTCRMHSRNVRPRGAYSSVACT